MGESGRSTAGLVAGLAMLVGEEGAGLVTVLVVLGGNGGGAAWLITGLAGDFSRSCSAGGSSGGTGGGGLEAA